MSNDDTGPNVWEAYLRLRSENVDGALALSSSAGEGEVALRSIALVAQGMACAARHDEAGARRCFENAFALGVPLAANLRQCGRYFLRAGAFSKAYECFSLLDALEPGANWEFFAHLPQELMARYGASRASSMFYADRPLFYSLRFIKDALINAFGAYEAGFVYGQWVLPDVAVRMLRAPRVGLQEYARQHAEQFEELVAPADVTMHPPAVFQAASPPPLRGRNRSVFFCVLRDIVVTSKSNLLLAPDHLLMDFQGDELGKIPFVMHVDPLIMHSNGSEMLVFDREESSRLPALERAFALCAVHSYNFGHWIFEVMFQVWATLSRPGFETVTLLIDEQMPPQHRELLEFFVGPDQPILALRPGDSVRVAHLWGCSKIAYWPAGDYGQVESPPDAELSDTHALAGMLMRLQDRLDAVLDPSAPRRIYLTRKPTQGRPLLNRHEVEAWFRAHGFEVMDLGDLRFIEQLRYLRNADMIVLEDGSQIFGPLFARSGTRIGVLAHPSIDDLEWPNEMFRNLGHHVLAFPMTLVRFNPDHPFTQYDLRAELNRLPAFIAELEARGSSGSATS